VGLWFKIFPRADWAFYLLAAANVGVGLAGIWALAGRFLEGRARLIAVLLFAFLPYYNYMATNFNANTMLLSLWPWTAYFFVRSLETRGVVAAAMFGALGAAGMLSKYYSILLLVACFAASLAHPLVRRYYASPAPYVAVAAAALVFAPHLLWALSNDLPTIRYAMGKTGQPWLSNFGKAIGTAVAGIAITLPALGVLIWACGGQAAMHADGGWRRMLAPDRTWIVILALGPFVITVLLGIAGYVKTAVNFLIPAFFMLPIVAVLILAPHVPPAAVRRAGRGVGAFLAAALLLAAPIAYGSSYLQIKGTSDVSAIAARDAARQWHAAFGRPVMIAAGTEKYSLAQPFYGPDRPAEFTHFAFAEAPWITPDRIRREGLLAICVRDDAGCLSAARSYGHAGTREVTASIRHGFAGLQGLTHDLIYVMTPPRP
jgi:4-amino-4-deoxy-L-arabinose transferase-like glycosyltransferase